MKFYLTLLREATVSSAVISLAERSTTVNVARSPSIFGRINIRYPVSFEKMTIAAIAKIEWDEIERLLRKVLQEY